MKFSNRSKNICVLIGLLFFLFPNLAFTQPEKLFSFMYDNTKILSGVLTKFKQEINVKNIDTIILAPTMGFPIKNYQSLKEREDVEILIASFYTIQPFKKYGLGPGVYGIILKKTGNDYKANFLDPNQKVVSSVQACVKESEKYYKIPTAKFNFNSPGMEICFDNICIEI